MTVYFYVSPINPAIYLYLIVVLLLGTGLFFTAWIFISEVFFNSCEVKLKMNTLLPCPCLGPLWRMEIIERKNKASK